MDTSTYNISEFSYVLIFCKLHCYDNYVSIGSNGVTKKNYFTNLYHLLELNSKTIIYKKINKHHLKERLAN